MSSSVFAFLVAAPLLVACAANENGRAVKITDRGQAVVSQHQHGSLMRRDLEAPARQVLPEPVGSFKQCKIVMENGADTRIAPACSTMRASYGGGHLAECDCHRQMNDHQERTCCDVVSTPTRIDSPMCFSTCKCTNATNCGMRAHQAAVSEHGVGANGATGNETGGTGGGENSTGGNEGHLDFHWSPSDTAAAAAKVAKAPAKAEAPKAPATGESAADAAADKGANAKPDAAAGANATAAGGPPAAPAAGAGTTAAPAANATL